MTVAKIHGAEFPIRKIFSNDFNFTIPLYQRPYSWTTEQAGEMFDDLVSFVGSDTSKGFDDLSPYFLGSIVLIKDEMKPDAEIVDGQQRLTTLTILLSALRHAIETAAYAEAMTDYLYQEGNALERTPNRYRLTLRERDAEFFRKNVQDKSQIQKLELLNSGQLTDSQRNIQANAVLFLKRLAALTEEQRVCLAQFVVNNCLLVVVSTADLDSAYRIFSILNDRGLDLSHSDILKSEIIGRIPRESQEHYNKKWEDAEDELGRDAFSDLFGYTRTIFRKIKAKETILKEFREHVVKRVADSRKLIDDVLIPYADAFNIIQNASFESTAGAEKVNELLRWLGRIDNTDWIPTAIAYFATNSSDANALARFLRDLERLSAFLMICRYGSNERLERFGRLLEAIENGSDLFTLGSPLQLSEKECYAFARELNGNVYEQVPKRRLYILLRLDAALSDGIATYSHGTISIEHVLPQNPPKESQWITWFPTPHDRERWVHRIGNLLLLNHKKNSSAGNYEFGKKKNSYFMKGGVCAFPLTTQAVAESEWTMQVVERRQKDLLSKLKEVWRISVDIEDEPTPDPDEVDEALSDSSNANFHSEVLTLLERHFGKALVRQSRSVWAASDESVLLSCQVSKVYPRTRFQYWFGLIRTTKEILDTNRNSFCAFGLGTSDRVLLIPHGWLAPKLHELNASKDEYGEVRHWHICFKDTDAGIVLVMPPETDDICVQQFELHCGELS